MPYYNRSWNVALGEPEVKSGRRVRKCPLGENDAQSGTSTKQADPAPKSVVDPQTIEMARSTLKREVEALKATPGAIPISDAQQAFGQYVLQRQEKPLYEGKHSSLVACSYASKPAGELVKLVCLIYEPSARVFITSGADEYPFLKVLRKLGSTHPSIIATLDIFHDEDRRVYIFQEFASKGNAYDYIKKSAAASKDAADEVVVDEATLLSWAQSIYSALDHCGALGIAHQAIEPKHILLVATSGGSSSDSPVVAKLAAFKDALVYYHPERADLIDLPCKSAGKRPFFPFQAPEVFGQPGDYFNVVEADVWSFGATFLFIAGGRGLEPPQQVAISSAGGNSSSGSSLDDALFKVLEEVAGLSEAAKYCLFGCLRGHTGQRTSFDALALDAWLQGAADQQQQQSPST